MNSNNVYSCIFILSFKSIPYWNITDYNLQISLLHKFTHKKIAQYYQYDQIAVDFLLVLLKVVEMDAYFISELGVISKVDINN